ncbi:hypothetical protein TNCV_2486831 [Trichonephila clavipes]|uniref:Uncharacterized protein n=1 Tax=Trichonephila clavipes TaxID=2585209 RepID=A0A8X7BBC1_TRICX|nr:hypothetical protein TNCV_2486831 [Trichonephila clavipes]
MVVIITSSSLGGTGNRHDDVLIPRVYQGRNNQTGVVCKLREWGVSTVVILVSGLWFSITSFPKLLDAISLRAGVAQWSRHWIMANMP